MMCTYKVVFSFLFFKLLRVIRGLVGRDVGPLSVTMF